jgi:hypothetical protein
MTKKTLYIDLGTKLGWYDGRRGGTYKLDTRCRYYDLYCWLEKKLKRALIEGKDVEIAYELIQFRARSRAAAKVLLGLECILELFSCKHSLNLIPVPVATIRKSFLGDVKGLNTLELKKLTVDKCIELGYNPEDDNAADAYALYHYLRRS